MSDDIYLPDGTKFMPYAERNDAPPWARCAYCGSRWERPEVGQVESWVQWRLEHEWCEPTQPRGPRLADVQPPPPRRWSQRLRLAAAIPLYVIGAVLFAGGILGALIAWIGTVGRLISIDQGFWAFVALVVPPADLVLSFYVGLGGLMIASIVAHLLGRVIVILGGLVNGS